jgi:GTP-binding protein
MNQLLGKERSLTGPEPGLTRDAVTDSLVFENHPISITDTAGWLDHSRLKHSELGYRRCISSPTNA